MFKVKNISKKIIGSQSFRLLPGETMTVEGDERWVQYYLGNRKLEKVIETVVEPDADEKGEKAEDTGNTDTDERKSTDENSEDSDPKKTARGRKPVKAADEVKEE